MRAVTDSGPTESNQPKPQAIQNLFDLMSAMSNPETVAFFEGEYREMKVRYGDMKKQLAEDIIKFTTPIRERILDIYGNEEFLGKVSRMGAEKAHDSGASTLKEVREIIGFRSF